MSEQDEINRRLFDLIVTLSNLAGNYSYYLHQDIEALRPLIKKEDKPQ